MSEPLEVIEKVFFNDLSAILEGNIFSVLAFCASVLRAFEFGLSDGAIDCTRTRSSKSSYASRLWDAVNEEPSKWSELLLFDVKSSSAGGPRSQLYCTSVGQRRRVAFYLCICSADPDFVELFPNMRQEAEASDAYSTAGADQAPDIVNIAKESRLFRNAHGGLDQCGAPFRMPIGMLPEAIDRVRECAISGKSYINPWTGVEFPDWKPLTTKSIKWIIPAEDTDHFTAYEEAMQIYQAVTHDGEMEFDFVGIQPRLADFKFIFPEQNRQVLIQHKVDGKYRSPTAPLTKVAIGRKNGFYFDPSDRFDFLMYSFELGQDPIQKVIYFIPESDIPDEFYTSLDMVADFSIAVFEKYRIEESVIDCVGAVKKIIADHPKPRRPGERPARAAEPLQSRQKIHTVPTGVGRAKYSKAMQIAHRRFFYSFMAQCAKGKSGLIFELSRNEPFGDFGVCRRIWTDKEARDFLARGRLPMVGQHLPAQTPVVTISYYARHRECWYKGARITAPQFRRLNSCTERRLIVWDISGPDTGTAPYFCIVPSEDVQPTYSQRSSIHANLSRTAEQRATHTPRISDLLSTGLLLSDYNLEGGPMSHEHTWSATWKLLNGFLSNKSVRFPRGIMRDCMEYRHSLHRVRQRLLQQHTHDLTRQDWRAEMDNELDEFEDDGSDA